MPTKINTLLDVELALNELESKIELLLGPSNIDLKQRRVINAGHSKDARDYITREELLVFKRETQASLDNLDDRLLKLNQRVFDLENP